MLVRAYILLDVLEGSAEQVVHNLRGKPGVVIADALEGPPDIVMMVEAKDRLKLAELATRAIASIESMTEGIHVLPAPNGLKPQGIGGTK
jgi:hypothetical protein